MVVKSVVVSLKSVTMEMHLAHMWWTILIVMYISSERIDNGVCICNECNCAQGFGQRPGSDVNICDCPINDSSNCQDSVSEVRHTQSLY